MQNLLVIASIISVAGFSFTMLEVLTKKFDFANSNKITHLIAASINAILVSTIYSNEFSYTTLNIVIIIILLLESLYISKLKFRQSAFLTTSILLNVAIVHTLIMNIFAICVRITVRDLYYDNDAFLLTLFLTNVILGFVMMILKDKVDFKKITELANARFYSDIMSIVSLFLISLLGFDIHLIGNIVLNIKYAIATFSTILFVFTMYYCLLYFNMFLVRLHPFKRKADEARQMHKKITRKKIEAEFKLYSDDLTKLYNRRFIFSKLDELCQDETAKFGLAFIDLVSLKNVNDTFGHKVGDEYIIEIATILKNAIREEDLSARIGGDEFLLVLVDIDDNELEVVINRIKNTINRFNESKPYVFHANIGYMCFDMTDKKQSRAEMLNYVDELMNIDKEAFYSRGGRL